MRRRERHRHDTAGARSVTQWTIAKQRGRVEAVTCGRPPGLPPGLALRPGSQCPRSSRSTTKLPLFFLERPEHFTRGQARREPACGGPGWSITIAPAGVVARDGGSIATLASGSGSRTLRVPARAPRRTSTSRPFAPGRERSLRPPSFWLTDCSPRLVSTIA